MIHTGFESKVKVQQIIGNQLPEFVVNENPKALDFLKQYYISQEFQGGPIDLSDNLDQYLKLDNLTPDVVVDSTTLTTDIGTANETISVSNTKGFPSQYGLLKINDEIITYTGKTSTTFTGCIRGFCGITSYHEDLKEEELVFSTSAVASHTQNANIQNLSSLFLKEFYRKIKTTLSPGLENVDFNSTLNVGTFLKEVKSLYESKGTDESFRILFNALYGETPQVVNLEEYLIKPSAANYVRREIVIAEALSGNPIDLVGQTIFKSDDLDTNASISEVETFTRAGVALTSSQQYFKISLFRGYSDVEDTIQGNFKITPATRALDTVSVGSSVITVDSTVGFGTTGVLVAGINTNINYTKKSVNQFFGCNGIVDVIKSTDSVRNNETYFGYENGDTTKKVKLRLTGVLSEFEQVSDTLAVDEGQIISVKNVGDSIKGTFYSYEVGANPITAYGNMSHKRKFANSLIYNTCVRYNIKSINNSQILFDGEIDRTSLKKDDRVEIVVRSSNDVVLGDTFDVYVETIIGSKQIKLTSGFNPTINTEYDLRRKVNIANSTSVPLEVDKIVSDVQNLYTEGDDYIYIASNSVPSKTGTLNDEFTTSFVNDITTPVKSISVDYPPTVVGTGLTITVGLDTATFSAIQFDDPVPFVTGDQVYYEPSGNAYVGLETGSYFVGILTTSGTSTDTIQLYSSKSFINSGNYIPLKVSKIINVDGSFVPEYANGDHKFTLFSQRSNQIDPQKLLKKFPLEVTTSRGKQTKTDVGSTGLLINGVEITNYKSNDHIYYGPLKSIDILNNGSDYDLVNPPKIEVASGTGTTALVQPVIEGSIEKVLIDKQQFNINEFISINITGGNGDAVLEPAIARRSRGVEFDGRNTNANGGISTANNTIKFLTDHDFFNQQQVIYNSNDNLGIGVGIGTSTLVTSASYFVKVLNSNTVKLYNSAEDVIALSGLGTNPIGLSTYNLSGTHKFVTLPDQKFIDSVRVLDGGKFTNRKLLVKPSGISTQYNKIVFDNHGFNNGDVIEYNVDVGVGTTIPQPISGLTTATGVTTTTQYYNIVKLDNDSFQLSDAGVGVGASNTNFERGLTIDFSSQGTGYQVFKYPDVEITLRYTPVGFGTTSQSYNDMILTPSIRGSIVDSYLYETGTGYGSTILNFEKKPTLSIKTGKSATLKPVIVNGIVEEVNIQYGGEEYFSIPELQVIDPTGKGIGAELRPVIIDNKITDIKIINTGIGYSNTSSIRVISSGKNAKLDASVRPLSVDLNDRMGDELLLEGPNNLSYSLCGYAKTYRDSFGEVGSGTTVESRIIGWAYDGNPIYGSYGYDDPAVASNPRRLISGYETDITNIVDRPVGFTTGFFVDDYKFTNNGDLDVNNGRFGKTPEYPEGVYAYFATIDNDGKTQFPYFIGDSYRSVPLEQNIDQSFDFKGSDLKRNTFPYRVADKNADNDFIIETNELEDQKIEIESVTDGSVDQLLVSSAGENYKINDSIDFDNIGGGSGVVAKVSSLKGKDVIGVSVTTSTYEGVFSWVNSNTLKVNVTSMATAQGISKGFISTERINAYHNWINNDNIIISGVSTSSGISSSVPALTQLDGNYQIGISSQSASLISDVIPAASGVTTEIYVSSIPNYLSIGSKAEIGGTNTEELTILNIYRNLKALRVVRSTGLAHSITSPITYAPDSFTIEKTTDFFESEVNDIVYFNPTQSVGFGTTSGVTHKTSFTFGNEIITRNIPTQRIYLENHPFKVDQELTFDKIGGITTSVAADIVVSDNNGATTFNLPSTVYVADVTPNTIALKTGIGTTSGDFKDLYFTAGGADFDSKYNFKTNFPQITGEFQKITGTVAISTVATSNLKFGDQIKLDVKPDLSVGIGASTAVRVIRDSETGYMLIDPVETSYTNIDVAADTIRIDNHGFKRGDKIFYTIADGTFPTGLTTNSSYFTYVVNENFIQLSETSVDCLSNPPKVVDITAAGVGTSKFYQINPQLEVVKNNNLVFDLSDSSLSNYNLKFYYDNEFKNNFVSTGSTTNTFSIVSSGTTTTLNHDSSYPSKLYYSLERSGFISTADTEVSNYSEIIFVDSLFNNSYNVVGVATTSFDFTLNQVPEKLSYSDTECDSISYTTKSLNETGGIHAASIVSGGVNYKKLPNFVGSSSTEGTGGYVIAKSKTIGNIKQVRIINEGFEYSADSTLEPTALISPLISIKNSNTIGIVSVTSGGSGFTDAPNIVIVDSATREKLDGGILLPTITGSSISSVEIVSAPNGLPDESVTLFTINNDNGVGISEIVSNSTGIFTCYIDTPSSGFSPLPFSTNDEVFIEGVTRVGTAGSGFNSSDYGYKFGKVINYTTGLKDVVTIDLETIGVSTNTGIAATDQGSFAMIINRNNYPSFTTVDESNQFIIGEELMIDNVLIGLVITHSENDFIKVFGDYDLKVGDIVTGQTSGSIATISSIQENLGKYSVKFSVKKNIGWSDDIGKLDLDTQVTADNDYYQNLSYTVKSTKGFDELRSPVSALLHTSGLKNFADVGIGSTTRSTGGISTEGSWRVGTSSTDFSLIIQDLVEDTTVWTINDYDEAYDYGNTATQSRFIKLENKPLSDYSLAKSNEVLKIDNINQQFSNLEGEPSEYLDLIELNTSIPYQNLFYRITNLSGTDIQTTDLVVLDNGTSKVLLEKSNLEDDYNIGVFSIETNLIGMSVLRFTPNPNAYDYDYDLKEIKKTFDSSTGIGTFPIGFVNKTGFVGVATTATSGVTTTSIISVDSTKFDSFHVQNHLVNKTTNEMNYVEIYVTHDGTDTYTSEYFLDTHNPIDGYSGTLMGSFSGELDGSVFSLQYENDLTDEIKISSNIVGFGKTSVGTGTYRFLATGQAETSERSALYQSNYAVGVGTTSIVEFDSNLFNAAKSIVQVSVGSTRIVSEVKFNHDTTNTFVQTGPFLSNAGIGTVNPIGVFTGVLSGGTFALSFTPENGYASNSIQVDALTLGVYTDIDTDNIPLINDFEYGKANESINAHYFNAINGLRIDRKNFTLKNDGTPIFAKTFDPNSSVVNLATGLFSIDKHLFRTNEELIYTPGVSFVGVGSTAMQYQSGAYHHQLPSSVFAIRNDANSFYISTTREGAAVTFVGVGTGNAHEFAMAKADTKAVLSINDVIQAPLAFSPVSHTLQNNPESVLGSAGIGPTATIFSLSGISSLAPTDILKVDDEYMKVLDIGIGTETSGPITVGIGSTTLVQVERGFVGSAATAHTNTTTAQLYKGSYRILGKDIWFTEPPRGNPQVTKNINNLEWPTSDFNGRVFLRSDYTTNQVYDDVSSQFSGIATNFDLKVNGATSVGMGTIGGNGIALINGIYQRPTAANNPQNNYEILDPTIGAGTTSIMFTGISANVGDPISINENDINQNQLPRGGVIISLGSTPGRGYAPLVPAQVYPQLDANGTITSLVSAAATGPSNSITTASYNNETGSLEITTENAHNFEVGIVDQVKLAGLEFTCSGSFNVYDAYYNQTTGDLVLTVGDHYLAVGQNIQIKTSSLRFTCAKDNHATNHDYPRVGDPIAGISTPITATTNSTVTIGVGTAVDPTAGIHTFVSQVISDAVIVKSGYSGTTSNIFPYAAVGLGSTSFDYTIVSVGATNKFTTDVGINSIPHTFVGGGSVMPWYGDANLGSGYYGDTVSIGVTDMPFTHKFVSAASGTIVGYTTAPSYIDYNPATGYLVVSLPNHGKTTSDTVTFANDKITLTCSKDNYATEHTYPRASDRISGIATAITAYDTNTFTVYVGENAGSGGSVTATIGIGGTLTFAIGAGGTNYQNPIINIPEPSYAGLGVTGISRLSVPGGTTTDTGVGLLLDLQVSAASTVGIGSTQFAVNNWEIARNGYAFQRGDVFAPVGLVTDASLSSPIEECQFTVLDVYNDPFAAWQFGQFDYIDSIKPLQDGSKRRFDLKYDGDLLSFELPTDPDFPYMNLANALFIIVNGIIQEPGVAYEFEGGTSFIFTEAPKTVDDVAIFFYRGSSSVDTALVTNIIPSIKEGDSVQMRKIIEQNPPTEVNQTSRFIADLTRSDVIETNLYTGDGISDTRPKSLSWTKQKIDRVINGQVFYKSRDALESLIFPTAKIIGNFSATDNEVYLDNADLFAYDLPDTTASPLGGFIVDNTSPVAAALTATVSPAGTISALTIVSGGSGYVGATTSVSITAPPVGVGTFIKPDGSVGIGSTATATVTVTNGVLTGTPTITGIGLGYTTTNPPQVIAALPSYKSELITNITSVKGFSGIVTGIGTAGGVGSTLAIKFHVTGIATGAWTDLSVGYPISVFDTQVGSGVSSVYESGIGTVGVGTTFLDNIYRVAEISFTGVANSPTAVGLITCNVEYFGNHVGIASSGTVPIGGISWGRLAGTLTRNSPVGFAVSNYTVNSGLTTFPTLQRRTEGIRDTGGIEPN